MQSILSDDENVSLNSRSGVRRITANADIMEALQHTQKENYDLRQLIKKLTVQVASLTVTSTKGRKSRKKKPEVTDAELLDDEGEVVDFSEFDQDIAKHGRKYSLMVAPWIEVTYFDELEGRPNVDVMDPARFKNNSLRMPGVIAELYDVLPVKLHKVMENHSRFVSIFRLQVQNTRSNAILAVRLKAGSLFRLDQRYFETTFDRSNVPELVSLLKQNPEDTDYPLFAPILFEGLKYDATKKKLFKNPLLPEIAKIMLRGKSSTTKSKPQTLSEIWKVTSATSGLIAFSAILARFLVSPDQELRLVGPTTKIEWFEHFMRYKALLTCKSKKVDSVFEFFNKVVFNAAPKPSDNARLPMEDELEDFEDALKDFAGDDSFQTDTEEEVDDPSIPNPGTSVSTSRPFILDDDLEEGGLDRESDSRGVVTPPAPALLPPIPESGESPSRLPSPVNDAEGPEETGGAPSDPSGKGKKKGGNTKGTAAVLQPGKSTRKSSRNTRPTTDEETC